MPFAKFANSWLIVVVVVVRMLNSAEKDCKLMLLFYTAQKNRVVDALESLLVNHLPPHKVSYCNALDVLEKRLRRPRRDLKILLLCVFDAIEMAKLAELRYLLMDLRLLLVLPSRDDTTVAWAHQFGPRFIAYADTGVDQISAVLEKMINTMTHSNVFLMKDNRLAAHCPHK